MPRSYWEYGGEEKRKPFWVYVLLAMAIVLGVAVYFLSQGRVVKREVTEEVSFVDVPEPEVEEEEEPVEPEIEEIPDIEIPDLPTTRVDPVQEEFDQRQMAENPLALVGEADEGADAFQLQSASRNRGLLRGAPPGTNAEGRYWGLVQSEIRTHLYRYPAIDRVEWQFILMLRVNEDASITILGIENVQPQNLQDELRAALADFTFVSQPPPSGVRRTNRVRLRNERD